MHKLLVEAAIDAVQSTKKIAVDTFVKHEGLAKSLNQFVDTQTEYTKKAVEATTKIGSDVYSTITDSKFYTDTVKLVQEAVQSIHTQKGK